MSYNKLIQVDGKVVVPSRRNLIVEVDSGSVAHLSGIKKGDRLIRINETQVKDILDYRYLTAAEAFSLTIQRDEKESTREYNITIEKDPYEDLGLNFETGILDKANNCSNKCIFCFIDQLPEGMRETLYFKDDDSRLSFLQGNFLTLTNMTHDDIQRIIDYRISPINISVHTTNPELRVKMLNNRVAGKLYERMKLLAEARIQMGAQIVLVPGYNDGQELERTLQDLAKLSPWVTDVAIVPLGMTKYREGLAQLKPLGKDGALKAIRQVHELQKDFQETTGSVFARCSDEFYVLAGEKIPPAEFYDGYSQLEDGIGMIRLFRDAVKDTLGNLKEGTGSYTMVTGSSAFPEIKAAGEAISKANPGITVNTLKVENDFFGHSITVAGLLTGQDILRALKKAPRTKHLILPKNMFRSEDDVMLDEIRIPDIEKELRTSVMVVDYTGEDLIQRINETLSSENNKKPLRRVSSK